MAKLFSLNYKRNVNYFTDGNPESRWPHVLNTVGIGKASTSVGLPAGATLTRSTIGTLLSFDGLVESARINEARFQGARRVENMCLYSQDLSAAPWLNATPSGSVTGDQVTFTGAGNDFRFQSVAGFIAGNTYRFSWEVKQGTKTAIRVSSPDSTFTGLFLNLTLTPNYVRYSFIGTANSSANARIGFENRVGQGGDGIAGTIFARNFLVEDVTGQAIQAPSEYVSTNVLTTPFHGAGVDGVKYFSTTNGNTVVSNVVTEAVGTKIPTPITLLVESAATNLNIWSENILVASGYTSTPVLTRNQVSPRGDVTATLVAGSGTSATQRLFAGVLTTVANQNYPSSMFIKAGTSQYVALQFCNGVVSNSVFCIVDTTTWQFVNSVNTEGAGVFVSRSITPVAGGFYRISINGNLPDTDTRFRFALTNNINVPVPTYSTTDTVIIWGMQIELGVLSSYIVSGATATPRAADIYTP